MSTLEPTIYECTHGRVAGGVCVDCRRPVAGVCPYCGVGVARERGAITPPPAPPWACTSCGEPYPWAVL